MIFLFTLLLLALLADLFSAVLYANQDDSENDATEPDDQKRPGVYAPESNHQKPRRSYPHSKASSETRKKTPSSIARMTSGSITSGVTRTR